MKKITFNTANEKKTFQYHMIYSLLEGIIFGVLALNEFVFIKSLKGSTFQLGVLFQLSVVVFILLIFFNVFFRRIEKKQKLLRNTALLTRLPLLLVILFPKDAESYLSNPYYHYIKRACLRKPFKTRPQRETPFCEEGAIHAYALDIIELVANTLGHP